MQRARVVSLLEIAEERIALAQANVDAQRERMERLRGQQEATGTVETNLTILELNLSAQLLEQARLRSELGACDATRSSALGQTDALRRP